MRAPDDLALPFLLTAAFRTLADAVNAQLEDEGYAGVRAPHGFALQAIGAGCTAVELGARLGVTKQAAAKTATGLVDLGLVERRANPADRREKTLVITRRGRRLLARSAELFRTEIAGWRARAGDAQVDATLTTLAVVCEGQSWLDVSAWVS